MGEKNILLSNDHSLASTSTSATVQAILWRKDWCPCIPARFVIVLWCFLGLFCTYALRTTLSIAILAMVKEGDSEDSQDTGTKVFNWNAAEQGLVLAAYNYGFPWLRIPGGLLADRFGAKYMVGIGILCSSITIILIPIMAPVGFCIMIVLQVISGLFEGLVIPSMYAMLGKWAPPSERTRMVAFIISGETFGTSSSCILSAIIIVYGGGWPNVFYIYGSIGVIWFAIWLFVAFDSPAKHPRISVKEQNYIESSIDDRKTIFIFSVPWKQVLTSGPVWAISIASFCGTYGYTLIQTVLPTYYRQVVGFNLKQGLIVNGIFSAIPYALKFPFTLIAGPVADYLIANYLSTTTTRKIFCFLSFGLSAIFLVLCGFIGGISKWAALIFVTLAVGANGLEAASFTGNHIDIASNYAGFLYGLTNSLGAIGGILAPQVAKAIANLDASAPHEVLVRQWRNVFIVAAEIYLFGTVVYAMLGSGEKQPWANGNNNNRKEELTSDNN